MSFFVDSKYLMMIAHRLPRFKKKQKDLWNCRCIICGDSTTNSNKTRGYFYRTKNDMFYKCHNCSASMHFGTFLRRFDTALHQQYQLEIFTEQHPTTAAPAPEIPVEFTQEPTFAPSSVTLDDIATRLDTLPDDNPAVAYCLGRGIPREKFSLLYYIEHVSDISKLDESYKHLSSQEDRLLLPLYNAEGVLSGVTMRALGNQHLRYLMTRFDNTTAPLMFGLSSIDREKPIHVVEGPIDSLFLDNAVACCGTSFSKIDQLHLPTDKLIIIADNQPRNLQVCKIVERYVNLDYKVCLWPKWVTQKDINDMADAGHDVRKIIADNTYQGLMARMKFTEWRQC